MKLTKAVVVLSGGQDSVTCLGLALASHHSVSCISFIYGQKHSIEIEQAKKICAKLEVELKIIDISFLGELVTSALTGDGDVNAAHPNNPDLPASFVPNRNALFLTIAHAYAQEKKADFVYTGVCQTDYSGYPDCRKDFVIALQDSLNLGYVTNINIITPLMYRTKAETFKLAAQYDCLNLVIEDSHTCYNGDRTIRHHWGYGCGECGACKLRAKGWEEYCHDISADDKQAN